MNDRKVDHQNPPPHQPNLDHQNSRGCLVRGFEQQFSLFKQYYTYFYTLFHPQIFPKNTNNVTRTTLSNGPLIVHHFFFSIPFLNTLAISHVFLLTSSHF